jgi:hypothetical protein
VIAALERRLSRYIQESKDLEGISSEGNFRALMSAINKRKSK